MDCRSDNYCKKDVKNGAYNRLLQGYQKLKADATVDDVKKKINTLRSNFRKELKKIHESKKIGSGTEDIYESASWIYQELLFLKDVEKPVSSLSTIKGNEACAFSQEEQTEENIEKTSTKNIPQKLQTKKRKRNEEGVMQLARDYLTKPDEDESEEIAIGKVWGNALKKLRNDQKILAEKFINDILFEAKIGTLSRMSMTINESNASRTSTPVPLSLRTTPPPGPHSVASTYYINYQPTASYLQPREKTIFNLSSTNPTSSNDTTDTYRYSRTAGGSCSEHNFYTGSY